MTNCKQCGNELSHVEGRKKKSFCNVNCRNKYFYAARKELIATALNKDNPAPKTEKRIEPPQDKKEGPKEAAIAVKSFRPSKEYDTLIRTSNDKAVLESLKAELPLNEMVAADKKKEFSNRIEFKLKRL